VKTLYLDTETTGLSPRMGAKIVEIAIVDDGGRPVLDTLVNPERPIPLESSCIHGISDAMVSGAPTMRELWPTIEELTDGAHVVIYNAAFDRAFFPNQLSHTGLVSCAMLLFAEVYGEAHPTRGGYKWQKLMTAAEHIGYEFSGAAHRALADALACRAVWRWLKSEGHVG
jgi:DNA polymerase-3 subunit epsilon